MTRVERAIEIDSAPEDVFAVLTDLDRLPEWATIVVATRDVSRLPLAAGCTFRQTVRVLGQEIESEWHVLALEAPRLVSYEAQAPGGGRMAMTQRVLPSGRGSRVELEVDYELPGGIVGEIVDKVYMERHNEQEAERSLANLKEILERRSVRRRAAER